MNTETEYLKSIAEAIALKSPILNAHMPDHFLAAEAKRLEQNIIEQLRFAGQRHQNEFPLRHIIIKLTGICDFLYNISGTITPDVTVVMDLLTSIKEVISSNSHSKLKLPKAFIALHKEKWERVWSHNLQTMQMHNINDMLIQIAGIPFRRFTENKNNLYWSDYTWLKAYQSKLDIIDWKDTDCNSPEEALLSLLIARDYNDDRFYVYCKKYIYSRVSKITSKRNKLLEYAKCQKRVLQDTQIGMPRFDIHANTISTRLIKWIGEEMDFVEAHEREVALSKFAFKWNVETIAFFFKLLWDHQVFGKVSLESLSAQIACNCSSIGKDEFQATTIFSRFYVKDKEVFKTVEHILSEMLEDVRRFG